MEVLTKAGIAVVPYIEESDAIYLGQRSGITMLSSLQEPIRPSDIGRTPKGMKCICIGGKYAVLFLGLQATPSFLQILLRGATEKVTKGYKRGFFRCVQMLRSWFSDSNENKLYYICGGATPALHLANTLKSLHSENPYTHHVLHALAQALLTVPGKLLQTQQRHIMRDTASTSKNQLSTYRAASIQVFEDDLPVVSLQGDLSFEFITTNESTVLHPACRYAVLLDIILDATMHLCRIDDSCM